MASPNLPPLVEGSDALHVHSDDGADAVVIAESTRDGLDYSLLCPRHQWSSLPVPEEILLMDCPYCLVEAQAALGHERYRQIHARLAARS